MQKVVPVTGQQHAAGLMGKPENRFVGGIARKGFAQQRDVVAELLQQITQVIGGVMIEQELQSEAWAICLATSRSISPRWSS